MNFIIYLRHFSQEKLNKKKDQYLSRVDGKPRSMWGSCMHIWSRNWKHNKEKRQQKQINRYIPDATRPVSSKRWPLKPGHRVQTPKNWRHRAREALGWHIYTGQEGAAAASSSFWNVCILLRIFHVSPFAAGTWENTSTWVKSQLTVKKILCQRTSAAPNSSFASAS